MAAFWIDESFDREHGGRFDAEVRRRSDEFADTWGDISPVTFAVVAWRMAAGLEPGFVRHHRRIIGATAERSAWDGGLVCDVTIASRWPAELTWSRQWGRDRGWRDWPQLFGQYVEPAERDLARSPHLRASLRVQAPVPLDDLPPAPEWADRDLERTARRAVTVLVRELNELLDPILDQLESGIPADS